MTTIKVKFRASSHPGKAGTLNYQREFGIRNALKKLNRQLEKVADSFGNYTDI